MVFCIGVRNLKFLASTVPEIQRGPNIPKVGNVTPDLILHLPNSAFSDQSDGQI